MSSQYPQWIDEYARAMHRGFTNMMPASWGPLDMFAILGLLSGSFISKVYEGVQRSKKQGRSMKELTRSLSSPSSLRASILFLILEYQQSVPKDKAHFRKTIEFFIEVLFAIAKKDQFAYECNIAHSDEEILALLDRVNWEKGNPEAARAVGKLYAGLTGLSYALYRDFFNDEGCEIYGPYDASEKFGQGTILVMKHFPRIKPVEIWPKMAKLKYSDIKVYQVYRNVSFACELWGVHHTYEGDVINNLVSYGVCVDGRPWNSMQEMQRLTSYFSDVSLEQSLAYESLTKEDLKKLNLEWLCYKFFDFFKLAGMDWRPTQEMLDAVRDKDVPDRLEQDDAFPCFEEYTKSPEYEIYWLKDLYQNG